MSTAPSTAGTVVVFSTAGSRAEGERLATALVDERLAACVNLVPVTSVYRWQGAIERAQETLLIIKTRRSAITALGARLTALHSYEVPEVVAVPIVGGARRYLAWLRDETTARPGGNRRRGRKKQAR